MRREVVFTGLGLIAGAAVGLVVGRHWPAASGLVAPGGVPPGLPGPAVGGDTPGAATPAVATDPRGDGAPEGTLAPAELRRRLEQWLATGGEIGQMTQAHEWLEAWARTDPVAVLTFAHDAPRFPQRNTALGIAIAAIAKQDPAGALDWLADHLSAADQKNVAEAAVARIGHDFPREALRLGFNAKFSIESYWASDLLGTLATTSPQEALGYFARLNHDGRQQAVGPLVSGWFNTDREAALRWCDSQRDTTHFNQAARALIQTVSAERPAEFDALVKDLKLSPAQLAEIGQNLDWNTTDQALVFLPYLAPADTQRVMSSVLDEQLPVDPAGALKFARDVLPADQAPASIAQAWTSWLQSDRKAALAWAATVADPAVQEKLQDVLRGQQAESEPRKFLDEFTASPSASAAAREHLATALGGLARQDTAAAARWIREHPELAPAPAIGDVVSTWMNQDATAAFAWVQQLPAGAVHDRAVRSAIEHWVGNKEFDLATQAIATVAEPGRQNAMRMLVFAGISDRSRAEAVKWLDQQPIHPEVRASWIAMMRELAHDGDDEPGG